MNPAYLGDSYDLVKRFLAAELRAMAYEVAMDPMFTGDWHGGEQEFFRLVGMSQVSRWMPATDRTALFLDPDTGVNKSGGKQHVSFTRIAKEAVHYRLVSAFDQSFSRQLKAAEVMHRKLKALRELGVIGMYYDSHARFLFASKDAEVLNELRTQLVRLGVPPSRLIADDA